MAVERRFATTMREEDSDAPGIVLEDDGTVWVVGSDASRVQVSGTAVPSVARVVLDHTTIKELPGTPAEIIPAPGVGKALFLEKALLYHDFDEVYTLAPGYPSQLEFDYGSSEAALAIRAYGFLNSDGAKVQRAGPWVALGSGDYAGAAFAGGPSLPNTSVIFYADNDTAADFGGGTETNELLIVAWYTTVDLT